MKTSLETRHEADVSVAPKGVRPLLAPLATASPVPESRRASFPAWAGALVLLGLSVSFQGYRSRDGDQAYRLPILLHMQDQSLYKHDSFVRAFDFFNPHQGYLRLLKAASWTMGLSVALFVLYVITYLVMYVGARLLTTSIWPGFANRWIPAMCVALVLASKAGNIGTNHLFETMLLDRQMAFALGWCIFGVFVGLPRLAVLVVPILSFLACVIHPSLGLQIGLLVLGCWFFGLLFGERLGFERRTCGMGVLCCLAALAPSLAALPSQSARLFEGMDVHDYVLISAWIQSPQHMLPSLWRTPQWLAGLGYIVLAVLTLGESFAHRISTTSQVKRFTLLFALILIGLGASWYAIEILEMPSAILFQPFRMATVVRGLALVLIAGRIVHLLESGGVWERGRAFLLIAGLTGDWSFVVAASVELAWSLGMRLPPRTLHLAKAASALTFVFGVWRLSRHDTESGHWRLLAAVVCAVVVQIAWPFVRRRFERRRESADPSISRGSRVALVLFLCWAAPLIGWLVPRLEVLEYSSWGGRFVEACVSQWRFDERPRDDTERLALWCRDYTPRDAVFIGPPGQKTFRLWSKRSLAFNRAGSPYHAEALADWFNRFKDHVGFDGSSREFAQAYLRDRQKLERQYDLLNDQKLHDLAKRQGELILSKRRRVLDRSRNVEGRPEGLSNMCMEKGVTRFTGCARRMRPSRPMPTRRIRRPRGPDSRRRTRGFPI